MTKTYPLALLAALLAAGCSLTLDPSQYAPKSASDCGPSQKVCGYKCVANDDPATGCGGESCQPCAGGANAIATCGDAGGVCRLQCNVGWGDCDAIAGCETPLDGRGSLGFCGACNRTCLGSTCDPGGYCPPSVAAGGAPVRALAPYALDPTSVFVAVDALVPASLWQATFTGSSGTFNQISSQVGTPIQCLSSGTSRLFYGTDDAAGATVASVPNTSVNMTPTLTGITVPTFGPCLMAPESPTAVWWIAPGGRELWGIQYDSIGAVTMAAQMPAGTVVGSWRAVTVLGGATTSNEVFIADDGEGGRILRLPPLPTSPLLPVTVATGAGEVGALAVRLNALGKLEIYWGDLATGSVVRQVDGVRTTVFRGSGPTSRMRIAATPTLVAWLDTDAGTVQEYLPDVASGAVVLLARATSLAELAASPDKVFWSRSGDPTVYSAPR